MDLSPPKITTAGVWRTLRDAVAGKAPEQAAQVVLHHLGVQAAPIPIERALRELEVKLYRMSHADAQGMSGAVTLIDGEASICVNATEAPVRQRFTMAHELGHLLMHPLGDDEVLFRDTSFAGNVMEAQANQFAAGMLMPLWLVEAAARVPGMTGQRLCTMFDVSAPAMKIRLEQLRGLPIRWG